MRACSSVPYTGRHQEQAHQKLPRTAVEPPGQPGPQADGLAELLLQHVLADYHGSRGHVLVVRWLYALALSLAAEQQEQRGKGELQ